MDRAALTLPLDRHEERELGLEEAKSGNANPNQEPSVCRGTCWRWLSGQETIPRAALGTISWGRQGHVWEGSWVPESPPVRNTQFEWGQTGVTENPWTYKFCQLWQVSPGFSQWNPGLLVHWEDTLALCSCPNTRTEDVYRQDQPFLWQKETRNQETEPHAGARASPLSSGTRVCREGLRHGTALTLGLLCGPI